MSFRGSARGTSPATAPSSDRGIFSTRAGDPLPQPESCPPDVFPFSASRRGAPSIKSKSRLSRATGCSCRGDFLRSPSAVRAPRWMKRQPPRDVIPRERARHQPCHGTIQRPRNLLTRAGDPPPARILPSGCVSIQGAPARNLNVHGRLRRDRRKSGRHAARARPCAVEDGERAGLCIPVTRFLRPAPPRRGRDRAGAGLTER
jgi:hypothetical protein